ncbi:MAG: PKD domain-containing protein [Gemmatimonadaceae bacterium]
MSQFLRRLTALLGSLVLAVVLASCTERSIEPTVQAAGIKPSGPSMGYAPVHGCDNLTPATMCAGNPIPLPVADTVRIEQLRVCKYYPGGVGPDVEIKLVANYVQFQDGPQTGTYTLHSGECRVLWRNGEDVNGVRSTDIITVTETPVPGYTTSSQVETIIRDQQDPAVDGGPISTFTKVVNAPTSATSVTTNIGGSRVPGALVIFTNTKINEHPHVIVNGPYVNVEGSTVTFSSAGTNDPEGDPLTYFWTFGDGGTSTAQNPTHTYADNGVYPVTVTVDDGNGPLTANTTATITNLAPVPTLATSTPTVTCGQTGYVTSTFTDPGIIDNLWSYSINWGDGSSNTTGTTTTQSGTISGSHLYAANGTYTVTITVTDKDGASGTATTAIVRACTPPPPPGPSCTYTQGYWKNHESAWPAPYSPTAQWLNSTHKVNGVTWDGLMGMNVAGGNSYMQLAHQWIAAKLNLGGAASSGNATVDGALSAGGAWLITNTPASTNSVPNIKNSQATAWASTLDDYNNGRLNLPHCD